MTTVTTLSQEAADVIFLACHSASDDFPTSQRIGAELNGGMDAYVVKVDVSAGRVVWTARLGGDQYDGAFRIAIETGTPIRPVLFLDARKRMDHRHLFTLTPGRSRLLYMPEIPVTGLRPEDLGALKSKVYEAMEEALLRYR